MTKCCAGITCFLSGLLLFAVMANAGGVDPREMPAEEAVKQQRISATPAQTSAAVSKARQAVTPAVEKSSAIKEVQRTPTRAKAAPVTGSESWQLSSREGGCAPLSSLDRKIKVGNFNTPQEFARKLQQRGHQAFVLDIGDVRDTVVRVKVPDLELDLTFVKAAMCR